MNDSSGSCHTKRILSIQARKVYRCALKCEGGVSAVLIVLSLCIIENHRALRFADDIPLGILYMLIKNNKLTTSILLNEVIEIHASATHDDYQVILARCRDISLLCRSRKCRNIMRIEEISLQGFGASRLKRHRLDHAVFIRLREGLR